MNTVAMAPLLCRYLSVWSNKMLYCRRDSGYLKTPCLNAQNQIGVFVHNELCF